MLGIVSYCAIVTLSLRRYSFTIFNFKNAVTLKTGLLIIQWPWNLGWGSLKVIENYTIQSGTHDFLVTFHSNHRPISHRFRDKRRYPSKITRKSPIFPPPCIQRPRRRGSPRNFVSAHGSQETTVMGLSDGRKSFQIALAVFIIIIIIIIFISQLNIK